MGQLRHYDPPSFESLVEASSSSPTVVRAPVVAPLPTHEKFFRLFPDILLLSFSAQFKHNRRRSIFLLLIVSFLGFVFVFEIDIPMMIASTRLPPSGSSGSSGSSYCFIDSIAFCSVCTLYHSFFFISNPKPLSGLLG